MKKQNNTPNDSKEQKVLLAYIGSVLLQEHIEEFNKVKEESKISFSEVFLHKIHKLMAKYKFRCRIKRTKPVFKRIFLSIMLICTFAFVGCASIHPVREALVETIITEYEKFFNLNVSTETPFEGPIVPKTLTYVPDGFELVQEENNGINYTCIYFNENKMLMFSQTIIEDNNFVYDNENSEVFHIYYNDLDILVTQYVNNNNAETSFVWNDNIYLYEIYGDFIIYEAIQILNGIR